MTDQALSDLKVVEWGSFISAPFCTKLMADMGAEVIKVEPPVTGEEARQHGPFPKISPIRKKAAYSFTSTPTNTASPLTRPNRPVKRYF